MWGQTENISARLAQHNRGAVRSTKAGLPCRLIYNETFETRHDAFRRERQIKSYKSGEAFKKLIESSSI